MKYTFFYGNQPYEFERPPIPNEVFSNGLSISANDKLQSRVEFNKSTTKHINISPSKTKVVMLNVCD